MMVCVLHWNLSKKATGYWNLCFLKVTNLTRATECGFINGLIFILKYYLSLHNTLCVLFQLLKEFPVLDSIQSGSNTVYYPFQCCIDSHAVCSKLLISSSKTRLNFCCPIFFYNITFLHLTNLAILDPHAPSPSPPCTFTSNLSPLRG